MVDFIKCRFERLICYSRCSRVASSKSREKFKGDEFLVNPLCNMCNYKSFWCALMTGWISLPSTAFRIFVIEHGENSDPICSLLLYFASVFRPFVL